MGARDAMGLLVLWAVKLVSSPRGVSRVTS